MPLEGGTQERQKTQEFPYNIKRKKKTSSTNKKWKKQPFHGQIKTFISRPVSINDATGGFALKEKLKTCTEPAVRGPTGGGTSMVINFH